MGKQIKISLLLTLFLLQLSFACTCYPTFYFSMGKNLQRYISFSSACFWYRKHTNNDNNIFPLASFMTDSQYSRAIQFWKNLNNITIVNFNHTRDLSNRHNLFSIIVAEFTSFSKQVRTLKTDLLQFNIKFF